jgi:hypothetical protein
MRDKNEIRELSDAEIDCVSGGGAGWNGGHNHKIGNKSTNPNVGNGAYVPGN